MRVCILEYICILTQIIVVVAVGFSKESERVKIIRKQIYCF